MEIKTEALEQEISERVGGYKHGYFVTVDTIWTEDQVNQDRLYRFTLEKLPQIVDAANQFCFGRAYLREKPLKLRTIAAIEVGKERRRLHAHMIMLHRGDCERTVEQLEERLRKVCKRVLNMSGVNAVHVQPFDKNKDWPEYFLKSTQFMHSRFGGFMNLSFY